MEILLADDNPEVRSALRLLLEQEPLPFSVMENSDMQGLFASLKESYPVAVLLDWELPGFQGKEDLDIIHSICPGMKVIAMSSRYEARHEALKAGVDTFISKVEPAEKILAALYAHIFYVKHQ
jgi:DNA-binding NarL/FixJ family response regulator